MSHQPPHASPARPHRQSMPVLGDVAQLLQAHRFHRDRAGQRGAESSKLVLARWYTAVSKAQIREGFEKVWLSLSSLPPSSL